MDVDLDRLADYAAGLLDPAEAAEVARLVERDARWRDAFDAVTGAEPLVRAALADLPLLALPDDVAVRIDAALAGAAGAATDAGSTDVAAPQPPLAPVVELAGRTRRQRWSRLAVAGGAVAAAVVAVTCGSFALLRGATSSNPASTSAGAADGAKAAAPEVRGPQPVLIASGTDYTVQTLSRARTYASTGDASVPQSLASAAPNPALPPQGALDSSVPAPLGRLLDPTARDTCFSLIIAAHGGTPVRADYARFLGRPALVVVLSGPGEVVVVGPDCGLSGTAEIYAAPLR